MPILVALTAKPLNLQRLAVVPMMAIKLPRGLRLPTTLAFAGLHDLPGRDSLAQAIMGSIPHGIGRSIFTAHLDDKIRVFAGPFSCGLPDPLRVGFPPLSCFLGIALPVGSGPGTGVSTPAFLTGAFEAVLLLLVRVELTRRLLNLAFGASYELCHSRSLHERNRTSWL